MKLSELKQMVAEEYSKYLAEQAAVPGATPPPAISVSDDDIQAGRDPEDILRNIFDMLKSHFEAEDSALPPTVGPNAPMTGGGAPVATPPPMDQSNPDTPADTDDDDMMDADDDNEMNEMHCSEGMYMNNEGQCVEMKMEKKDDDKDEDTIDENSTTEAQYQKTGYGKGSKTAGKDAGYKPAKTTKGRTGYDAGSKALQERFQKLANIIK